MSTRNLSIVRIGNSRGIRLPAATLKRYGFGDELVMEERSDGILLRPAGGSAAKLSWEETAREMAAAGEEWTTWEVAASDGLNTVPWVEAPARRVAEQPKGYRAKQPPRRE